MTVRSSGRFAPSTVYSIVQNGPSPSSKNVASNILTTVPQYSDLSVNLNLIFSPSNVGLSTPYKDLIFSFTVGVLLFIFLDFLFGFSLVVPSSGEVSFFFLPILIFSKLFVINKRTI